MQLRSLLRPLVPPQLRQLLKGTSTEARWRRSCNKWLLSEWYDEPGAVALAGWAIVPANRRDSVRFTWNGQPFDRVEYPLPRPDVANNFPYADAHQSGFVIRIDTSRHPRPWGPIEVRIAGRDLGTGFEPTYLLDAPDPLNLPDAARRRRVIGWSEEFSFRHGGCTTARVLEDALRRATGGGFAEHPRILDWGCGSGRVARHLLSHRVTGADVDFDNVAWCRDNLPGARFELLPLRPPTQLPSESFDCIIGVSVLTHLREADQHAWLAELQRLLRPGGIALLTFHGEASGVLAGLNQDEWRHVERHGIYDRANRVYDAALAESDYYRDTFHSVRYVRREWRKYFDELAHLAAAVFHQDLMVLRRRSSI